MNTMDYSASIIFLIGIALILLAIIAAGLGVFG
jgi:hypothetical protein